MVASEIQLSWATWGTAVHCAHQQDGVKDVSQGGSKNTVFIGTKAHSKKRIVNCMAALDLV
jgi:hypothetical protein